MGNSPSKENNTKPRKQERKAVFDDNNDEAIFKKNFGLDAQHMRRPTLREPAKKPALPNSPPPSVAPPTPPKPKTNRSNSNFTQNNIDTTVPISTPQPPPPPPPRHQKLPPPIPEHGNSKSRNGQRVVHSQSLPTTPIRIPSTPRLDNERPLFIAQHRFVAKTEKEISLEEGDLVYLLNPMKGDWWYIETKHGSRGFVPITHVKRVEVRAPWFAGNISRITAERRIMQPNLPIGTFLIREKEPNSLVLTLKSSKDAVNSYMIYINKDDGGYFMMNENDEVSITFFSLEHIINFFSDPSQDIRLCTLLTVPAPPLDTTKDDSYTTMKNWEINRDSLRIFESIGEGQFGEVHRARLKNVDVAVKKMRNDPLDKDEYSQFVDEATMLTNLNHPNLIRLLAVCTREKPYYIITEYMSNGSLKSFLSKDLSVNALTTVSAMNISAQIAAGMQYLVDNCIVHRDLAARNVLVGDFSVDRIPHVKIADFGLARKVRLDRNYEMNRNLPLAVKWMAPEVFDTQCFNHMTDVWSFGILLWEIGSLGETPYREWSAEYTMERVLDNFKLPAPQAVPKYVYDEVFLACVDLVPEKRPTFSQLFQYFDDFTHIAPLERSLIRLSKLPHPH